MLNWYEVITKQNYFTNNENIILQENRLAMGAPSSSIISELFLQHLEQTKLTHIAQKLKIVNYFRYVDDILIIFLLPAHRHQHNYKRVQHLTSKDTVHGRNRKTQHD